MDDIENLPDFNFEIFKVFWIRAATNLKLPVFDNLKSQGAGYQLFSVDEIDSLTAMDITMEFEDLIEKEFGDSMSWSGFDMKEVQKTITLGALYELFCKKTTLEVRYTP